MKTLTFFAAGLPKGQPRVKACRFGNKASVYDPGTANYWKSIVRLEAQKAWDRVPFVGPVNVELTFWLPRPKAHFNSKGLKPTSPIWHMSKPDADNLAKAVLDALTNLGLWRDDSAVARLRVSKKYGVDYGCQIYVGEFEALVVGKAQSEEGSSNRWRSLT